MLEWYKHSPHKRLRYFRGSPAQYCVFTGLCDFAFNLGGLPNDIKKAAKETGIPDKDILPVWEAFREYCALNPEGRLMPLEILQADRDQKQTTRTRAQAGQMGGKKSGETRRSSAQAAKEGFNKINNLHEANASRLNQSGPSMESTTYGKQMLSGLTNGAKTPVSNEINDLHEANASSGDWSNQENLAGDFNEINGLREAKTTRYNTNTITLTRNNTIKGEISISNQDGQDQKDNPPFLGFQPLVESQSERTVAEALSELFPAEAIDPQQRTMLKLVTYVHNVGGSVKEVERWPGWFQSRHANRAQTILSFQDSFHLMIKEPSEWPVPARFLAATSFNVNFAQIDSANSLQQSQINQILSVGRALSKVIGTEDRAVWQKRGFTPNQYLKFWDEQKSGREGMRPIPSNVLKYWEDFEKWLRGE